MGFRQRIKETEGERVARWKEKNPEKVANQRRRRKLRDRAEARAKDPTGELDYGPVEGVDKPYQETAPMPPPKPDLPPSGIEEPPEIAAELEREHKRLMLQHCREQLEEELANDRAKKRL